jgi:Na+-driven multidrug efflux pump
VIGGLPTVLSMSMPQLLRNAGYSKEAGLGVGLGSLLNVALDPLFMFVILPRGNEVLGAAVATMLSNVISLVYFIVMFRKVRSVTVLDLPRRIEDIGPDNRHSMYSVGIPAALSIFFFDLVTIVINRLTASYGDIPLAAMGIVLKLERIPINTGLGICLGMVPLVAYNFGSGDIKRMKSIFRISAVSTIGFACVCAALFLIFSRSFVSAFIADEETVSCGVMFLRGRCLSLPFMMAGYLVVNFMNAIGKGKISFELAVIRHIILLIPVMLIMNSIWGLTGLVRSQLTADVINTVIVILMYRKVTKDIYEIKNDI